VLTGAQCAALARGLLARWRAYYAPGATLVRLLALQGICWPATHVTLRLAGATPAGWALVGTATCCSRAVQMWATSNLAGQRRRWEWDKVLARAAAPMGACYFVMAWADVWRRALGGC
jgi:hypothetical protein